MRAQVWRFTVTGAISALIDLGITLLLVNTIVGADSIARTAGFIAGTTAAYKLNRRWTFRSGRSTKRFVLVWVLYGLTFFVNIGLYTVTFRMLDPYIVSSNLARFPAFVVGQGVATVLNFLVQRLVIFKLR